jgi:hypothetical protein
VFLQETKLRLSRRYFRELRQLSSGQSDLCFLIVESTVQARFSTLLNSPHRSFAVVAQLLSLRNKLAL